MRYKNAIFDLDGTLFDSGKSVTSSLKKAMELLNLPPLTEDQLYSFIGPSIYDSFINVVGSDEETALKAIELYRQEYKNVGIFDCDFYDGVKQMLETLINAGVKLCIASSKPLESVHRLLDRFNISKYFSFVSAPDFGERSSDKSPLIAAAKLNDSVVMVGDRKFDILGAKANNIDTIAVKYGFAPKGELEECKPTYFAANPKEVTDIILGTN